MIRIPNSLSVALLSNFVLKLLLGAYFVASILLFIGQAADVPEDIRFNDYYDLKHAVDLLVLGLSLMFFSCKLPFRSYIYISVLSVYILIRYMSELEDLSQSVRIFLFSTVFLWLSHAKRSEIFHEISIRWLVLILIGIFLGLIASHFSVRAQDLFTRQGSYKFFFNDRIDLAFALTLVFYLFIFRVRAPSVIAATLLTSVFGIIAFYSQARVLYLIVFIMLVFWLSSRLTWERLVMFLLGLLFFVSSLFLSNRAEFFEYQSRASIFSAVYVEPASFFDVLFGQGGVGEPVISSVGVNYAHNWLVSGFINQGIFGVILFLWFFRELGLQKSRLLLIYMVFFLFHNGFDPFLFSFQQFFVLAAVIHYDRRAPSAPVIFK